MRPKKSRETTDSVTRKTSLRDGMAPRFDWQLSPFSALKSGLGYSAA